MNARVHFAQLSPNLLTHLDRLRAHGYTIMENLAAPEVMDAVCTELEPWFDATPRCQGDFYGWNTTRFGSVLTKSPASHALLLNGSALELADAVLGAHCDWFQLNLSQGVRIHPGERQQAPHRDEEMWPCSESRTEYLINFMWALSDFTEENGATRIWPRSHFSQLDRQLNADGQIVAEMPRGSALIYLGSVTHCAGANRSSVPRTGLIFSYCLGWLKQYENGFLTYPPEIAKDFPKAIQDLLGYRIHRPNLGGFEGQDPALLFTKRSHALAAVDAISAGTAAELRAYYEQMSSSD